MYVYMRFRTAKTQLRAVGGYFSLPPWLNTHSANDGRASVLSGTRRTVIVILVYLYSAWADHEMGLTTSICMYVC